MAAQGDVAGSGQAEPPLERGSASSPPSAVVGGAGSKESTVDAVPREAATSSSAPLAVAPPVTAGEQPPPLAASPLPHEPANREGAVPVAVVGRSRKTDQHLWMCEALVSEIGAKLGPDGAGA